MSEPLQPPQAQNAPVAALDIVPPEILELLGPPPLLPSENANVYHATLAFFARTIRPGEDLIAWMLIKDLADHRVEIARYRAFKAALAVAAYRRSQKAFWNVLHHREIAILKLIAERDIFLAERSRKPEEEIAKCTVEIETKRKTDLREARQDHLSEMDFCDKTLPTETDVVEVFGSWIEDVERIDILLQAAETRFRDSLDEIDRHLRGLGRYCREELDKIIDGEVVEPQGAGEEAATQFREAKSVSRGALADTAAPKLPVQNPTRRRASNAPQLSAPSKPNQRARRRLAGSR